MCTNLLVPERIFDQATIEIMDRPQLVSAELLSDLRNLQQLNRYFGSYRLIRHFLRRWFPPGSSVKVIDLCTGFGDIPRFVIDWCRANDVSAQIAAIDFQPATLDLAKERSRSYPEITFTVFDVLQFVPESQADFVFCSLALHHFADDAAVRLLQNVRSMARTGILVADLERTDLGILGIYLLTACAYREPMTRFDARLSIRRAFSFSEMRQIASQAGWERFGQRRFPIFRQAVWLEG
ncbi:MAG: methyltransferase domain-containing protein [Verrucomicrobia bacterium]|nr:methyltransferase domain-containing protein [Verrucomicrobiota bacterium]